MTADRKNSVFGDQAGSVELLWGERGRPSRGPKPALSLERITRAAIGLADAEGLAAVSMQRVAGELDFTKMSLYRYVPGKAELVALMIDTAMGAPPAAPETPESWRPALHTWAGQMWDVFSAHPWLLGATVGPRVMGPNELSWVERALTALDGTGLDGGERFDAVFVVIGHLRSTAQQAAGSPGSEPATRLEQAMSEALNELLRDRAERYPALTAAVASAAAAGSRDKGLQFGLDRILDGLEVFITRRAAQ